MNPRRATHRFRLLTIAATLVGLSGVMAGEAAAACFAPRPATGVGARGAQAATASFAKPGAAPNLAAAAAQGANARGGPIVGLWRTVFTAKEPSEFVFDEGFQQFQGDGNELMISRGVPPDLGNVCIGVWELTAAGVIKLRHVTWNWAGQSDFGVADPFTDAFSNLNTGHFQIVVTLRVNSLGTEFSGTWEAVSFDRDGVPLAGSQASGTVEGKRIGVN